MVADRFRSRVLRFRSTLSHRRRALRYRPVLRTQRPLLLPNHRPERTLGLMGLRIHRSSSLSLPLTSLDSKAPAIITLQLGQLSRPEQVIAQYGARKSWLYCAQNQGRWRQESNESMFRRQI